jgi:hypothetical protein
LTHVKLIVVILPVMMMLSIIPSGAAITLSEPTEPSIKVTIDKHAYARGDTITVHGSVKYVTGNIPLTVTIMSPDTNLVYITQVLVSHDGTFAFPVKVEGPLWRMFGTYTISVQYGFKHISSQTTFEFKEQSEPTMNTFNVKDHTSGQNFDLNYTITGGTVKDVSIEPRDLSLIVKVESTANGVIKLQIPRLLIDAKMQSNQDEPFLVLIDDDEIQSSMEEPSDFNYRVLKIPFSKGDSEIDIIGTTIIPEFSDIVGMVFVTALAAPLIFIMFVNLKYGSKKLFIIPNV